MGWNVEEPVPEVHRLGPVVRLHEADLHPVDERVGFAPFDLDLGLRRFVGPDVVVCERVVDGLQAHLDPDLVGGGGVKDLNPQSPDPEAGAAMISLRPAA